MLGLPGAAVPAAVACLTVNCASSFTVCSRMLLGEGCRPPSWLQITSVLQVLRANPPFCHLHPGLYQFLPPDSRELEDLVKIISSFYLDSSSRGTFSYCKARLIHNELLEKEVC